MAISRSAAWRTMPRSAACWTQASTQSASEKSQPRATSRSLKYMPLVSGCVRWAEARSPGRSRAKTFEAVAR
jgi:hypothetical protein